MVQTASNRTIVPIVADHCQPALCIVQRIASDGRPSPSYRPRTPRGVIPHLDQSTGFLARVEHRKVSPVSQVRRDVHCPSPSGISEVKQHEVMGESHSRSRSSPSIPSMNPSPDPDPPSDNDRSLDAWCADRSCSGARRFVNAYRVSPYDFHLAVYLTILACHGSMPGCAKEKVLLHSRRRTVHRESLGHRDRYSRPTSLPASLPAVDRPIQQLFSFPIDTTSHWHLSARKVVRTARTPSRRP